MNFDRQAYFDARDKIHVRFQTEVMILKLTIADKIELDMSIRIARRARIQRRYWAKVYFINQGAPRAKWSGPQNESRTV